MTTVKGLPETMQRWLRPLVARRLSKRYEVRVRGEHFVPAAGPVILASNHVGWLDGPLTVATSERPVHSLSKSETFEGKSGLMMRLSGQIPLHRGRTDSAAVRASLRVLNAGQVLLVYPEGQRGDGEVHSTFPGAAYFALATGAPIVPVAVFGTREPGASVETRPGVGRQIDVVYGRALHVDRLEWPRDVDAVSREQERLADALRDHVAETKKFLGRDLPGPPPGQEPSDD